MHLSTHGSQHLEESEWNGLDRMGRFVNRRCCIFLTFQEEARHVRKFCSVKSGALTGICSCKIFIVTFLSIIYLSDTYLIEHFSNTLSYELHLHTQALWEARVTIIHRRPSHILCLLFQLDFSLLFSSSKKLHNLISVRVWHCWAVQLGQKCLYSMALKSLS